MTDTFRRDGVDYTADMAGVLGISRQAFKRWSSAADAPVPRHVELSLHGYVAWRTTFGGLPGLPEPTVSWFRSWAVANDLITLDDMGGALGRSRPTVCGWLSSGRFPSWVVLACIGHGVVAKHRPAVDRRPTAPDTVSGESETNAEPIGEPT